MTTRPVVVPNDLFLSLMGNSHLTHPHEITRGIPPDSILEGVIWSPKVTTFWYSSDLWDEDQAGQAVPMEVRIVPPEEYIARTMADS